MSILGTDPVRLRPPAVQAVEHVVVMHPLRRVLAFTRRSIDEVINDPMARNEVHGYYKLYRQVQRAGEVRELEEQWDPLATLGR